jgi:flagellar hook-associated protein FlgK
VFTRDPNNIDLVHRAAVQAAGGSTTPDFTITDSNPATATIPAAGGVPPAVPAVGSNAQPAFAVASTSLLGALGANQINGIDQNSLNAFGSTSGSGANALLALFSNSYGVPALQTTSATAVPGPVPVAVTVTPTVGQPGFSNINVGAVLTIDAGTANQENVTVTAVNRTTGSISFIAKNTHLAGFSITTAQTQSLQAAYAGFVATVGLDTSTAITGATSQATLTSNVDAVRQSTDGINIDEETQNLVKFQNAYGAAAHVISVLSQMLTTAINLGQ